MPAEVVSHYRLLNPLGSGGMGVVYRAEDTTLRREVALKFLSETQDRDAKHLLRFKEEARTASALNHPHICTIYEVGESEGEIYIAMEYVEGRPLSDEIHGTGLPIETILRYGRQIAAALEHAHERGVVHRDLKPINVRITPGGDAKVLDFGLAVRTDSAEFDRQTLESAALQTGLGLAGTIPYMAPEQLQGRDATPRTDIWSFGVVLYEMASGQRPFHGENFYRLCTAILQEPQPPLSPRIPLGLVAVIRRCLEKDPARRYQRASEVRAALEALEPSSAVVSPVVTPAKPRWTFAAATATGVVLLALGGYFGWARWWHKPPASSLPAQIQLAVLPSEPTSQDPSEVAYENGLSETLTARLTELTGKHALAVIPASEMRANHVKTFDEARQQFGANLGLLLDVQRAGGRVRVNYSLVDARTHQQIGGGTVTAGADDPFALQDQVAETVAKKLELELQPQELQTLQQHGTVEPAAYDFYLQGRGYLQDYVKLENVENAITVFQRALQKDPGFVAGYAGLGEAYWRKYQLTHDNHLAGAATENCQKAADRDPSLAAAHSCLGRVFSRTGSYEKAVEQYGRAVELEPTNDIARGGLAGAYEQLGRLDDAEKTFRQAIALRPDYWATYNWLGLFYQHHARYEDAAAMYSQVVSLAPDSFTGYYNLGGVRTLQGRYAEAIPLLEQSLRIRPTADARSNLATAYFQMRRYAEAAAHFEEALKLDEKNYLLWGNLGDAYYWAPGKRREAAGAYAKAIAQGEEKLRVNSHDAELLSSLAMYHAMRGEQQPALDDLGAALRLKPDNPDLLFNAGITYQQLGDTKRALDALEKAVAGGIAPAALRDTPNFDRLRDNPRFLRLIQR